MYSKTFINKELTLATFGYDESSLSYGSRQKIVVTCENCHSNIHREKRNANAKHKCLSVVNDKKRCFKCKEWKSLDLFNKYKGGSGGVAKMCRKCYNNHDAVKKCEANRKARLKNSIKNNDIEYYIRKKIYSIRSRCKRDNIEFDITYEHLLSLWLKQNGKCFYTKIPMNNSLKTKSFQGWDSPSIDRLEPSNGYTIDNVVWCIFSVNSFKQSLSCEEFANQVSKIQWWFKI